MLGTLGLNQGFPEAGQVKITMRRKGEDWAVWSWAFLKGHCE